MTDIPPKLLLRRDLRFTLLKRSPEPLFVIEDPIRQKYFRIGRPEYVLFTSLDGKKTLQEATTKANNLLQENFFTPENLPTVINWLHKNQLLISSNEEQIKAEQQKHEQERKNRRISYLNLVSVKVPLFNPDRLLRRIAPHLHWLTGPLFFFGWLCTLFAAILSLSPNWTQFLGQADSALSPGNLVFLWMAWLLLKVLHELFHALVCYRYNGRVHEAGILFILFIPLTYVNATASWAFVSRWQRIYTAFAGIYVEIFVAAVAALVWANGMYSISGAISHNIILVAGFSSLVFNANPLMRFDGYFILSDFIDIPNLYERGRHFVRSLFFRIFFGEWSYVQAYTGAKEIFIRCYGLASWLWRIFITITLTIMASGLFQGLGFFIALISGTILLGIPIYRLYRKLKHQRLNSPHQFRHFCWSAPLVTAISLGSLLFFRWSENIEVPAVVEYKKPLIIKAASPGFVRLLPIQEGSKVQQGDLIVHLENPELRSQLVQVRLQIASIETEGRVRLNNDNITEYQVLKEKLGTLQEMEAVLEKEVDQLEIRAAGEGTVVGERLDILPGMYLSKGMEICWLVDESNKTLHASVGQDDIEGFRDREGHAVQVAMPFDRQGGFIGNIVSVAPRATQIIDQPAFSAIYGGPVAVRLASSAKINSDKSNNRGYEFFSPRFKVEIDIPPAVAESLRAGQHGFVETEGRSLNFMFLLRKALVEKLEKATESSQFF